VSRCSQVPNGHRLIKLSRAKGGRGVDFQQLDVPATGSHSRTHTRSKSFFSLGQKNSVNAGSKRRVAAGSEATWISMLIAQW